MKKIYKRLAVLLILVAGACDLDGDLQNPNEVSVAGADVNLIMNAIQLDFADFFYSAHGTVGPLMRYQAMNGGFRYSTNYQPQNQNVMWSQAYQNILINAETMIPLAASKGLTTHTGVAKILEAYTLITLVDVFGDVPSSEALKAASGNFNPVADPGANVYTRAITLLGDARTDLTGTGPALARDIYYAGDRAKWTALANSVELKAQLNMSIMGGSAGAAANTRIAALLGTNLVDTEAENFVYKYSNTTVPDSRHPYYSQYYGPNSGQAGGYICTTILWELYRGKPDPTAPTDATKFTQDPRWRYYFYRQMGSLDKMKKGDPKALGCTLGANPTHYIAGNYPFCAFDPGFYGRDHGDASGTPPDPPWITAAGVYPAGGKLDTNTADQNLPATDPYNVSTKRGDGADGKGIQPIFMSFYTDFMKAEILARGGNTAGARAQLLTAIDNSITQVKNFTTAAGFTLSASLTPSTTNYKNAVGYLYDNTYAGKSLKMIGREFWVAAWGNGVEAYNSYRRTSGPDIMQPTIQTNPGPWLRSMIYPANYVNLNSSATQKPTDQVVKVFWDANADVLN